MTLPPFSDAETHQLTRHTGGRVRRSSDGSGWRSLFASMQSEPEFETSIPAVAHPLIVLTLRPGVRFIGRVGERHREVLLPAGGITLTPGGADMQVRTEAGGRNFDTMYLYLRQEVLAEMHTEMFESEEECRLLPCVGVVDGPVQSIAAEVQKMLVAPERSDAFYAETLSRSLAGYLLRNHLPSGPKRPREAVLPPPRLRRAISYVETCFAGALDLASIADAAGVSAARLTRAFKRDMNMTPYDFVIRTRVARAERLLITTRLPLAEVALRCGFSDQQHMTHLVRRVTGDTPGAIRRRQD